MISEFFNLRGRKSFFNRNFFIILTIDVLLLGLSWYGAYLMRFDLDIPEKFVGEMLTILPVAILIKLLCLYFFDVYRGMWRFTGISDLLSIIKAVSLSTLLIIAWDPADLPLQECSAIHRIYRLVLHYIVSSPRSGWE